MLNTKFRAVVLILFMVTFAWPAMMLLHELGHVVAAWITGGTVTRLVWHPLVFSRTDISPNPHPLIVVWAGPLAGCLVPLLIERVTSRMNASFLYIIQFFCGFCLLANGVYIGVGGFDHIGDAGDMLRLGTPIWVLLVFGLLVSSFGLWFWHLASKRLGFGESAAIPIPWLHVAYITIAALIINSVAILFGDPGS